MEYKDFIEQAKEKILDFLPEEFADATVEINQVIKNNDCVLDGLSIKTENSNFAPTVYLNPYFEQIQQGIGVDLYDVLAQIADAYQTHYMNCSAVTGQGNVPSRKRRKKKTGMNVFL